jgi:hypothetical protein
MPALQFASCRHPANHAHIWHVLGGPARAEETISVQVWRAVAVALNRMLYNDIATEAAFSPQVGS